MSSAQNVQEQQISFEKWKSKNVKTMNSIYIVVVVVVFGSFSLLIATIVAKNGRNSAIWKKTMLAWQLLSTKIFNVWEKNVELTSRNNERISLTKNP